MATCSSGSVHSGFLSASYYARYLLLKSHSTLCSLVYILFPSIPEMLIFWMSLGVFWNDILPSNEDFHNQHILNCINLHLFFHTQFLSGISDILFAYTLAYITMKTLCRSLVGTAHYLEHYLADSRHSAIICQTYQRINSSKEKKL